MKNGSYCPAKGRKAMKDAKNLDVKVDKNFSGRKAVGGPNAHKSGHLEVKISHTGKMRASKRLARKKA